MIADADFYGTQDFLAHIADGAAEYRDGFRRVPVENGQKILMLETLVGIQSAAAEQHVFEAHGGGFAKGRAYVKFIIPIQITVVNDVEDLLLMIAPVGMAKKIGDRAKLPRQPFADGNVIAIFQRNYGSLHVLLRDRPRRKFNRILSFARIGYVKHIA